jgi:iron complex outermembrane receptor protein
MIILLNLLLELKFQIYTLFFITFIITSITYAEDTYINENDLFEDIQTVTSATRLKQKVTDAPVSVTIIDNEMIEASGATEVHELMRLVPGFFSYSIWGGQYAVSSHYEPSDVGTRLEVQVNGRSVYEPFYTAVDWPSLGIDVADIDYIEVIRGSSATTYGSNAFLGAVNIITKSALTRPNASVRTRLGNIDRKELTLNKSGNIKDVNYAFSLVHKSNSGFPAHENPQTLRDLMNDDRDSLNVTFQGNYVPNLKNEILFEVGLGRTSVDIPSGSELLGFHTRKHKNNFQTIKWINKSDQNERSLKIYHSDLILNNNSNYGLLSDVFGITPQQVSDLFPGQQDIMVSESLKGTFSKRYDIEFEQKGKASKVDYVWGVGARTDRVRSPIFLGEGVKSENYYRLFGNIDWHVHKKFNANLGLLTERTNHDNWEYSPRLSLNYHFRENHTIRSSFTYGKNIPQVTQKNLNVALRFDDGSIIDTDTISANHLDPQTVKAYELAYIANFPSVETQIDIKVFREEMKDFIGLQIRPFNDINQSVRVFDNMPKFTTKGLELQATHNFNQFVKGLNTRLSYAYIDTDGTKLRDLSDPKSTRKVSSLPRHSATLLLMKKLKNQFNISSVLQYQSDYNNWGIQIKRVDLRVGKKVKYANTKGKVALVIQNAFNSYNDFSARNKFKTRAFLQLELDF